VQQVGFQREGRDEELAATTSCTRSQAAELLGLRPWPALLGLCASRHAVRLEHDDDVLTLAFGADGRTLVAAGEDRAVVLWDLEGRTRKMEVRMGNAVTVVAYSPDGRYIAAADVDASVTVWDTVEHEEVGAASVEGNPLSVALTSRPTDLLAVGTTAKKVMLFSLPELEELADLPHDDQVRSVSFSPDGCKLVGGGGSDDMHGLTTQKVDSHETKAVMWHVSPGRDACEYLGSVLFDDDVYATAFSPTGKLLAVGGEGRMIAALLVDRQLETAFELPCTAGVRCLAWSSDSRFLAEGGEHTQVFVWDILAKTIVLQLPKAEDWICSLAFSCDSMWLATCGFGDSSVTLHPIEVSSEGPCDEDR